MSDTIPTTAQAAAEIIDDGISIPVKFKNGETVTLHVTKLGRQDLPKLVGALGDETAEAALYLGWSNEQVAGLTDESFEAVLEEGQRQNFTRLASWGDRQRKRVEIVARLHPKLGEALNQIITQSPPPSNS